jgi:hypothetical protein
VKEEEKTGNRAKSFRIKDNTVYRKLSQKYWEKKQETKRQRYGEKYFTRFEKRSNKNKIKIRKK